MSRDYSYRIRNQYLQCCCRDSDGEFPLIETSVALWFSNLSENLNGEVFDRNSCRIMIQSPMCESSMVSFTRTVSKCQYLQFCRDSQWWVWPRCCCGLPFCGGVYYIVFCSGRARSYSQRDRMVVNPVLNVSVPTVFSCREFDKYNIYIMYHLGEMWYIYKMSFGGKCVWKRARRLS